MVVIRGRPSSPWSEATSLNRRDSRRADQVVLNPYFAPRSFNRSFLLPVPEEWSRTNEIVPGLSLSEQPPPPDRLTPLVTGAAVFGMALVVLAALSYQCAASWRWLRAHRVVFWAEETAEDGEDDGERGSRAPDGVKQAAIRISHSLPDLKPPPVLTQQYVQDNKDNKKVLRQTTLPSVPTRHQTFQRQLSHRLDFENVQFSVCKLEPKNETHIGLIKPELYSKELMRQESVDSSDNVEMEYCGKLHFALRYDTEMDALIVKVLEARDLPIKDMTGSSDPYVKVFLLPDRKKKFQTKVHRRNLDPVFNETFIFSVSYEDLRTRYLQFSVYDFDRFSRHDLMGQVVLKGLLDCTDLQQEVEYTMNILCPPRDKRDLGELMVSLCYLPTAGRLTVTIVKGRNLKAMDITGASDPYVKIYLVCEGKRLRKKRTSVKRNTLSPLYNEALTFDVPSENVNDVSLILKVIDYDRIGSDELMGCAAIGSSFIGTGRDHWLEMLDNPRKPVTQWYHLLESVPGPLAAVTSYKPAALSCLNSR
ncbi:synaptotagmin-9 isoform X2 [Nilaparvata lugens]|uniref:synaptotagmin-9 isoform X2 n=1 Tax=Nilaparvata lugens TaxID=108931 RepID=UPI00193DD743|nr:synaptotagmin-9 isoform X2 [Nilaparvata lugens]